MNGYYVYYSQNQSSYAKGQTGFLSITIKNFNGSYCTDCVVNGTLGGDYIQFTNQNNGSYFFYPAFTSVGNFLLDLTIYHPDFPSPPFENGRLQTTIPVFQYLLTINLAGGFDYKAGEELKVTALVKDEYNYPVTGAKVRLTIYYPNNSKWQDNVLMEELEKGLYFWNSTLPNIEGVYTIWVNASYENSLAFDSQTFHVAPWTSYFSIWNTTFYFWNNSYFVNWNGSIVDLIANWDKLWGYWKCSENNNMVCNLLWDLRNASTSSYGGGGSVVYQVYMEGKGGIIENITGVEFVYDNYFETSPDSYYPLPVTIKNNYNYTVSVKFYKVTDNVYFSPEYPIYINPNLTARVILYLPINKEGDFTYQVGAKTIYLANEENKTLTFYGRVNKFIFIQNFIQKYYSILIILFIVLIIIIIYKYLVGKGG
jgi:hypothetical protein